MARLLIIVTKSPYENAGFRDSLDFVLASTAYGHESTALFVDDGVYQLLPQDKVDPALKTKSSAKIIKSFPFFDIDDSFVCEQSLQTRNIDKDKLNTELSFVESKTIRQLIEQHDHLVTF